MKYTLLPPNDPRVLSSIADFDIEIFKKAIQNSYCNKSDKFKFHINEYK